MEDSEHVDLELTLEMSVVREGIKELAKTPADSSVLDAVLKRLKPMLGPIKAKYDAFNALRVSNTL